MNTETLARKSAPEPHVSPLNRSSSAKCELAMSMCQGAGGAKPRELSESLAGVPESLYLSLLVYAFHVAAVITYLDKHLKV